MAYSNESFVSESESNDTVKHVFSIFGYVIMGIFVTMILVWSYTINMRNQYMFITVFCTIVLIYCIIIIAITVINKSLYDTTAYTVIFGFTIFMLFMTFFMALFFLLKYFNIFSSYGSSSSDMMRNNDYYV